MNEPFCAPKMKGWVEASMHIFTRCKRPSTISGEEPCPSLDIGIRCPQPEHSISHSRRTAGR